MELPRIREVTVCLNDSVHMSMVCVTLVYD